MGIPYKYLKSIGFKLTRIKGFKKKVFLKAIPEDKPYPGYGRGDGTHYWIGYSNDVHWWSVMVLRKTYHNYKLVAANSGWSRYTLKELLERIDLGLNKKVKFDYEWFKE